MKQTNWFIRIVIVVAALVLSGCGVGGNGADGTSGGIPADSAQNGEPVYGGTLTVGIVGGSTGDSLDAHSPINRPDAARVYALYDPLATFSPDYEVEMALAEEITPSADGTTWTVTLRPDLKFSDGSPITADDVVFTYQRITDPEDPKVLAESLDTLDRDALRAIDDRTVEFVFDEPFVIFPEVVAEYTAGVVPRGYDPENPVGSGAFQYESFQPGQQSMFSKNPHYWREGEPYLDELVILNFPDDSARVNALLSGQVDAIDQVPLSQVSVVEANPDLQLLESETGGWIPFTMRVDQEPFDDPKVRQAFRLIVDRQQMVDQVLDGHGSIANDLYSPFDVCYDQDRPQRTQDIEQAQQLLAEAGHENLSVDLVTTPGSAGMVEAAQVFAQQAKEAGVNVNVRQVDQGVFYGEEYLNWTFALDYWITRNFIGQAAQSGFPDSPFNETHWDDAEWQRLVNQASTTVDEEARCELVRQAQDIEFERGGFIIWGFPNTVDAHTTNVHGLVPSKTGNSLSAYGFRHAWLDN